MHQNLRTSFVLNGETLSDSKKQMSKDESHEERIARLEANLREYQILVPLKEYGTFYCIYAKFNGDLKDGKFYPESCKLFLQNFDGSITVGLVEVEEDVDVFYDEILKTPVYLLKVHVRALHANAELKAQSIKVKDSTSLKNYLKGNKNNWNIELDKEFIDPTFLLRVLVIYDGLPLDQFNPKGNVNDNILIDSYRYKRDGDELFEKDYIPVNNKVLKPSGNIVKPNEQKGTIAPDKCAPSYVRFYLG